MAIMTGVQSAQVLGPRSAVNPMPLTASNKQSVYGRTRQSVVEPLGQRKNGGSIIDIIG